MRAFITGITGFAGSHLAEHLLAAGDMVCGCNRTGRWHDDAPEVVRSSVRLLRGDVERASVIGDLKNDLAQFAPDVVYHLAGLSIPSDCGETIPNDRAREVNVEGTRRILSLAAWLPRKPRVVFASSAHVYGSAAADFQPVSEALSIAPRGGYGLTKLAAEQVCREFQSRHDLEVIVVRAFPHAGPRQDERLMLASWCKQFATNDRQPIEVQTLDAMIDLSDVRDVARAYRLLALRGLNGQTYDVGSGIRRTSGEVFAILHRLADATREIVQSRPGVKFDPIASLARLTTDTAWQPEIPIEQTVADAWNEWRQRVVV